jgi:hypothetical protein
MHATCHEYFTYLFYFGAWHVYSLIFYVCLYPTLLFTFVVAASGTGGQKQASAILLLKTAEMTICSAPNCLNGFQTGHHVFQFPEDRVLRQKWAANCRPYRWFPTKTSVLCEVSVWWWHPPSWMNEWMNNSASPDKAMCRRTALAIPRCSINSELGSKVENLVCNDQDLLILDCSHWQSSLHLSLDTQLMWCLFNGLVQERVHY